MKLDVNALRYLSKDDFRVLTAVEMGMRNHEIVPSQLIDRIAGLKHGGTYKVMKNLLKHKLLHHDNSKYDGFRLTYLGYDFLAIKTLVNRGVFVSIGRQIGVGKESDIFEVAAGDESENPGAVMAIKLHRLGRTSFRAVKSKRDYLLHRSSFNWLYLSRLAALKEYAFMKALGEHGFPVPNAVDCNRHCVVMSLVEGYPLVQVRQLEHPDEVFETIVGLIVRLAEHGLIHCDFNEFNIMIDDNEKVTMIDFPQMVSVSHRNAQMYFDRDVECIFKFFSKRYNLSRQDDADDGDGSGSDSEENSRPSFSSIVKSDGCLDRVLAASGFTRKNQDDISRFIEGELSEDDSASSDDDPIDEGLVPEEGSAALDADLDSLNVSEEVSVDCVQEDTTEGRSPIFIDSKKTEIVHTVELLQHDATTNNTIEELEENPTCCAPDLSNGGNTSEAGEEAEDKEDSEDVELERRLNRQRRRAIAAARSGGRALTSRNSQKDKGGKSSQNSKVQRQLCKW